METFYPESRFGGFAQIDGTVTFYARVNALLNPGDVVVDFGCGRGAYVDDPVAFRRNLRILKGKVACVIGVDVSAAGKENPCLDEFRQIQGARWPIEDRSVNLIVCDNVLEHLSEPERFFAEAQRALAPGGVVCIRTPNRWSYIALLARIIPNRSHARVLQKAKKGLPEADIFPTLYRSNTIPMMKKMLKQYGFEPVVYGYEAEPSYLSFSKLAYALGVLHQKFAPGVLKASIFAFGKKSEVEGR